MKKGIASLLVFSLVFAYTSAAYATTNTVTYKKAVLTSKPIIINSKTIRPVKVTKKSTRTTVSSRDEAVIDKVIRKGINVLGTPYKYGSSGGGTFDCSGFTAFAYKAAAVDLPHSSSAQADLGKHVSKTELEKGDLIIFNNPANTKIGHVGIYIGNNNFIHASTNNGVTITSLDSKYYVERYVDARRVLQ